MNKERVFINLKGITKQMPFREYYRQRNTSIGKIIADKLELPLVVGEQNSKDHYHVMAKTVTKEIAREFNISSPEDFYGVVVDHLQQVEKSVFYPVVGTSFPGHYSTKFSKQVRDSVLKGYSFFDLEGALAAHQKLSYFGKLRLKLLPNSDGHGQFKITTDDEFREILNKVDENKLAEFGAVIEPNLFEANTTSVGEIRLGDDVYSFLAFQKDDIASEDGRNRYMGADLITIRGTMENLLDLNEAGLVLDQVKKAVSFHQAYSYFKPVISRISYDVLCGTDFKGDVQIGVTDITARLGGSCPAVMLGVKVLDSDFTTEAVRAEVDLNYQPEVIEAGSEIFINHPTLTITAKVTQII